MVTVRETWNDYSKGRRRTFWLFALSGLCLFAAGVVGDFLGWWTGLAFVPNALTSLSGFLVGAPIALVVLSTFEAERDIQAQRDKLSALSNAAWGSFAESVYNYCSQARQTGALGIPANGLSAMWEGIRDKTLETLRKDSPTDEELNTLMEAFTPAADQFDAALAEMNTKWPSKETLSLEWVGISAAWALLKTYVKVQRFGEEGLEWLPPSIESQIDSAILRGPGAVADFAALHDGLGIGLGIPGLTSTASRRMGMRDIPSYLRFLATQTRDGLYEAVLDADSPFNTFSPDEYRTAAQQAMFFLIQLGGSVHQAELQSGWPFEARRWGHIDPFGELTSPTADAERALRQMAFHLSGRFGAPASEQQQTGAPEI